MTGTPCQRAGVEMSLDTARRSACATSATNLAPHGSCSFLIDSEKPGDIRRSESQLEFDEERTKVLGMTASGRILEVVLTFRGEAMRTSSRVSIRGGRSSIRIDPEDIRRARL